MSEDQDVQVEAPHKPAGPTTIVVKTPFGGFREAIKGPDGKFIKKPRTVATNKDVQEVTREFLETKLEKGPDGKLTKRSQSRFAEQVEALHKLILDHENSVTRNAAVKAAELLWTRAYGKPAPSDKELDALQRAGIRTIFVPIPEGVAKSEQHIKETKPSFIEAEIIEPSKG